MEEAIDRQVVVVADDKVMLHIEGRNAVERMEIVGIDLLLDT